MKLGERYKLKMSVPAIQRINPETKVVHLPVGDVVTIISNEEVNGGRIVDIQWHGQKLMMFTADLREHGERIED